MATFDDNVEDFENRYAGDRGVHAKFYNHPEQDHEASATAGRPIFKDTEFVEIIAAGNSTNIIKRPARQADKQRFPRQYAAFLEGRGDELYGTPLTEVTWITRSQVEELAYMRICTLEQLAGVSDSVCGKVVGLYDLKRKAESTLAAAGDAAPMTELVEENKRLQEQLDAQKIQQDTMAEQIKQLVEALKAKQEPEGAEVKKK